jgi:magnesium and cobalt transporter
MVTPDIERRSQEKPAEANADASARARLFSRLREKFRQRGESLRESLAEVIDGHQAESGDFTPVERQMLVNIMHIGQLRVDDVMVPRADIAAIDSTASQEDLIRMFISVGYSRLPVYRETLDEPVGMVHIKDVLRHWFEAGMEKASEFKLTGMCRELLFVPPSMRAVDLLLKMRVTRSHMALVIDEFGGTDGLITIEDLVQEIVGEMRDEHDVEEGPKLIARPDGGFEADARVETETLEAATGFSLVPDEKVEYADTLGGLVSSLTGRVPQRGELITHPAGLEFEILEADPRSVKRLRVHLKNETPADETAGVAQT